MTTQLRFLGHAAFEVTTGGRTILIDPFLTGNPQAAARAEDLNPDYIIVSHGHGDHVGDTEAIAKRTGCLVISNYEIAGWFEKLGVKRTHGMSTGGSYQLDDGCIVKLTQAHHGSMLPDGSYGGCAAGILLKTADGNIYHACDTGLFSDMKLTGDEGLHVAILPIGDNYTMGPDDSLKAIELLRPRMVVPAHFNTFPVIEQDAELWASRVVQQSVSRPVVLAPGETLTLP